MTILTKNFLRSLLIAASAFGAGLLSGYAFAKKPTKPLPISELAIERSAYVLAYDGQHKQARWVYEHLTADSVQGNSDRSKFDFQEDPLIPVVLRATKEDYRGSGFVRGHLCPAADARFSDEAMMETFYLSNISPQCSAFNRGYWLMLERHIRELARQHGVIHVYTGGLYLPQNEADGKRYVKYQVIGASDIAVPTHYFKIVLGETNSPIEAFILPNEIPLAEFMTTIEKVEKSAGIVFKPESHEQ